MLYITFILSILTASEKGVKDDVYGVWIVWIIWIVYKGDLVEYIIVLRKSNIVSKISLIF